MSARDRVMARVSRAAAATGDGGTVREAAVAARLEAGSQTAPIPVIGRAGPADIQAQFRSKLEAADVTVTDLPDLASLPTALAEQLRNRNLPAAIRLGEDPDFRDLDWGTLDASTGPGRIEEPATLSRARMAMAETGTLVLASGPDNPVTLTFLGETHFAVVRKSEVVPGFEAIWKEVRETGDLPRTLNFVTGPSRSADIGQKLQLGAHGPVALHVFLIDDAS